MKAWVNGHAIPRGNLLPENLPTKHPDSRAMFMFARCSNERETWYDLTCLYHDVAGAIVRATWSFSVWEVTHLRRRIRRTIACLEQNLKAVRLT